MRLVVLPAISFQQSSRSTPGGFTAGSPLHLVSCPIEAGRSGCASLGLYFWLLSSDS
jgi:hypothetical protein